jgi:hypothetical protein
MGLSFDENRSLEEVTAEGFCLASDGPSPNSIPEMGLENINHQEWRDNLNVIDGSEDIQAMGSNGSTILHIT